MPDLEEEKHAPISDSHGHGREATKTKKKSGKFIERVRKSKLQDRLKKREWSA